MKKLILTSIIFFAALSIFSSNSNAQIVVVRPKEPVTVVARPQAPFVRAVWVDPEWRWDGPTRAYVYVPGHWIKERPSFAWVPGHWISVPGGYQWIAGYWRKVKPIK